MRCAVKLQRAAVGCSKRRIGSANAEIRVNQRKVEGKISFRCLKGVNRLLKPVEGNRFAGSERALYVAFPLDVNQYRVSVVILFVGELQFRKGGCLTVVGQLVVFAERYHLVKLEIMKINCGRRRADDKFKCFFLGAEGVNAEHRTRRIHRFKRIVSVHRYRNAVDFFGKRRFVSVAVLYSVYGKHGRRNSRTVFLHEQHRRLVSQPHKRAVLLVDTEINITFAVAQLYEIRSLTKHAGHDVSVRVLENGKAGNDCQLGALSVRINRRIVRRFLPVVGAYHVIHVVRS